jgi:hypothetical protein
MTNEYNDQDEHWQTSPPTQTNVEPFVSPAPSPQTGNSLASSSASSVVSTTFASLTNGISASTGGKSSKGVGCNIFFSTVSEEGRES